MSVSFQLVGPDENAGARARIAAIERTLARFPAEAAPRLRAFAREHAWTGDLVVSFPGLAAAIALAPNNATRDAAMGAVMAGAPLARVAMIAGTPLWLRACPPEAFPAPAPTLPDDYDFRRSIANHLPKDWRRAPHWFGAIASAYACADSKIALWFAREAPRLAKRLPRSRRTRNQNHRLVALFAWLCKHQRIDGKDLVLWNADMNWFAAHAAATAWRAAALLDLFMGEARRDGWFEAARLGAYEFAPLLTASDLRAEAAAMHNCVRSYGYDIASNARRLWNVRKNGERVATLSLQRSPGFMPGVEELSGPRNQLVDAEVVSAVHRWLCCQDTGRFNPRHEGDAAVFDQRRWRLIWREYWRAKQRIPPWLPLHGSESIFYAL